MRAEGEEVRAGLRNALAVLRVIGRFACEVQRRRGLTRDLAQTWGQLLQVAGDQLAELEASLSPTYWSDEVSRAAHVAAHASVLDSIERCTTACLAYPGQHGKLPLVLELDDSHAAASIALSAVELRSAAAIWTRCER